MRLFLMILFVCSQVQVFSQTAEKEVKQQIDSLVLFIKGKATESFAQHTVYRGDDVKRKWKDVYNPANVEELRLAKQVMEEMKKALESCNYKEFDVFRQKEQSEGMWYVYTFACGSSKRIKLSFLKIKGKYALGDIDVETDDEEE